MTQGKSKRVPKGKKSGKGKTDPFAKKEWYDVKPPQPFKNEAFCKTPVNKSAGTRMAYDVLKGRVYEVSVGELQSDQNASHLIMKLRIDEVRGKVAYTSFHGLRFTNDKLRSLVSKWHTLLQATVDVKTSDGYSLRLFAISQTKKRKSQLKKTCYAQSSQILKIVARMKDIMNKAASGLGIKEFTSKLVNNSIGRDMEKACSNIFPLENTFIYRVKLLKVPKLDATKLQTLHADLASGTTTGDVGEETAPTQEVAQEVEATA